MEFYHQIIKQISEPKDQYQIEIPEGWGQGRAIFGGIIGALLYQAMRVNVDSDRLVRALSVSFVGPVNVGPLTIEVNTLRNGGSVTQIEAKAFQNNQCQCATIASFGKDRSSSLEIPATKAEPAPISIEDAKELPYIPNVVPEFVKQFSMRWAYGGFPFSGSKETVMGGFMQFKEQSKQLADLTFDEAALVTLIDAWPPVQLALLKKPAPSSSLTWTMEFIHPIKDLTAESWLHYKAKIDQTHNGYGQTHAEIWSEDGDLLAISRQTVTVFD